MKDKPWTSEPERQLRDLLETSLQTIEAQLVLSVDTLQKKCDLLWLEAVVCAKSHTTITTVVLSLEFELEEDDGKGLRSSSSIKLPKELPGVEKQSEC